MSDAATCPKCGAETGGTNPAYRFKAKWKCGSYLQAHGVGIFRQSDKCRIAELERDLREAREENAALKREHDWREDPTYPNWGDVKIKNTSVVTTQEIMAAAKRLVMQGETLGGCGTPYGKHTGFAEQFDEIAVGEAYQKQAEEIAGLRELLIKSMGPNRVMWNDEKINAALERRK